MEYKMLNFKTYWHQNRYLIILFLIAVASIVLYYDRDKASNLVIVPDSVEYALAGHRFATACEYKILVGGQWLPPRYPPWFSVLVIAPAYLIIGLEPGNAIYPITIFGIMGLIFAFYLGKKIGGYWGGIFASLILLGLPIYRMWSKYVMTDVPATTLVLCACLLYLHLRTQINANPLIYLLSGFIVAFATSIRPVSISIGLPFLIFFIYSRQLAQRFQKLIFFIIPIILLIIASLTYNALVFGSPFRSGYHFWSSVPYDYLHLTFSFSYIITNMILLWKTKIIHFLCMAFVIWLLNRWITSSKINNQAYPSNIKYIEEFTLFGTAPIVLFHLFYFYPEPRFYLPTLALVVVIIGSIIGYWFNRFPFLTILTVFIVIVLSQFCTLLEHYKTDHLLNRYAAVKEILRNTPENAWIISGIEPAYIEYFVAKDSKRRIVPISRNIEYADKLITFKKVDFPNPPPSNWSDYRRLRLIKGGAKEAISFVASEQYDNIAKQISSNTKVFLDTTNITQQDQAVLNEIKRRFELIRIKKDLFELKNRD